MNTTNSESTAPRDLGPPPSVAQSHAAPSTIKAIRDACGACFELADAGEIALSALNAAGVSDEKATRATARALAEAALRHQRLMRNSANNSDGIQLRRTYTARADRYLAVINRLHGLIGELP